MLTAQPRTLLVFVDGLGLGCDDPGINPLRGGCCDDLARLLDDHGKPVDACLGVPGMPQSATGQTALLTGINAPARMGRHVEGFPGGRLRELIREYNIFSRFVAAGLEPAFANAYLVRDTDEVRRRTWQSVTTVMTLAALGTVRNIADLQRNEAVYQDLTRKNARERGFEVPLVSPGQAGEHLCALARHYDLTLFEYFQTDRAGHSRRPDQAAAVLALLDEFLAALVPAALAGEFLLLLTSDHGNIEDTTTPLHTFNPVPFAAVGTHAARVRERVASLMDIAPALIELHTGRLQG